jgi:glyoxylase-like metal-dependent hydrolase (beta-lactamase superfamily II)
MRTLRLVLALSLTTGAVSSALAQTSQARRDREITSPWRRSLPRPRRQGTHDLSRHSRRHLLADPLSVDTAQWLNQELTARFPGAPVRYVVLTHHHLERASGAAVFAKTAQIVAQASLGARSTPRDAGGPMPIASSRRREQRSATGARSKSAEALSSNWYFQFGAPLGRPRDPAWTEVQAPT